MRTVEHGAVSSLLMACNDAVVEAMVSGLGLGDPKPLNPVIWP